MENFPTEYAAQAYDAVFLLDSGIRGTGGKLDNKRAIVKAMRKVDFASVHSALFYNVTNFPIRDFFKREVLKDATGSCCSAARASRSNSTSMLFERNAN